MDVPGKGYGGYVPLKDIVAKGVLAFKDVRFEVQNNLVLVDGKPLQGLVVVEDYARIRGIHYTSWEWATQIRSMMRIEPSLNDPFVYLSEPGKMAGWPEALIKKETGAASANTEVIVTVIVPVDRVWIKASRDVAHYAITGIVSEIRELKIQKRRA